MIAWPSGVNQIIRNETTGGFGDGLITDSMRSGKEKVRQGTSTPADIFAVIMIFDRTEFDLFEVWYKVNLRYGAITFAFPKIAGSGLAEYRIVPGVKWEQFGRDTVKVTMTWRTP